MNKAVLYFVEANEPSYCPVCSEQLTKRSWRLRKLIDNTGNKINLMIRRLYCINCNRVHHALPGCIVPYKRHCTETIEKIINDKETDIPEETRTIQRIKKWWIKVSEYFTSIIDSITEKTGIKFNDPRVFKEIIRAVTNTNNWIFVR